jgi:hypothetical protein
VRGSNYGFDKINEIMSRLTTHDFSIITGFFQCNYSGIDQVIGGIALWRRGGRSQTNKRQTSHDEIN